MAKKVGELTGQTTKAGRPVYKTPEGELVSEKSMTIPVGDKWINVPSIHDGMIYSEDEIVDMLKEGKISPTSEHENMEEAVNAAKSRSGGLLEPKKTPEEQMDMFAEGGMLDEGGSVDLVSGNEVPTGSLQNEVRDDIDAKLSEGEFVLPADVVRYIGLENIMKMRDMAKEGLAKMEAMGQMGNSEEATVDDNTDFDAEIDQFIEDLDNEDEPQEFQVGGLAGQQPMTPEQQAGQIYQQTSGVGFLPPGVTAPGAPKTDLPQAPVVTPPEGGVPTYETKQYIGPNGEIRTFTFINGKAFPPIPEGFTLYDPTKVPEAKTGVPTAKVTQQDGGDGPDDTQVKSAKVDPTVGITSALAKLDPDSKIAKLAQQQKDLDEKALKRGGLSLLGGIMTGGLSLLGLGYVGYKYATESAKIQEQMKAELDKTLDPATQNIIRDAGLLDPTSYTNKAIEQTYVNATKAGASPALAAALATTTSRAFSEVDPDSDLATYEMQTADIFRDVTGGALDVGSAQTAMLTEQDLGLFDSPEEREAFYSGQAPVGRGQQAGEFQRTVNGVPVDDYSTYRDVNEITARTGYTPSTSEQRRGVDLTREGLTARPTTQFAYPGISPPGAPISSRGYAYDIDSILAGTQTPTVSRPSAPSPSQVATSIAQTEQQAREVSSGDRDLGGSDFGSQDEADAVASDGWGSDAHFDAIDAQFDSDDSSGGDSGGGSYCCTKMVEHDLWKTRREFALMHKWHREQPQWWRDGYDVWGNVIAETLLKRKTKFWTSVMQSFYDHHVKKQPLNFKSALANAIIYPGVIVMGTVAKITGRHINAV